MKRWRLLALALLTACAEPSHRDTAGPQSDPNVDTEFESADSLTELFDQAAAEFSGPRELLMAVAWEHTRWQDIAGVTEFEGKSPRVGIMGIPEHRIATAADLLGLHADMVRAGRRSNIRGFAAILDATAVPGDLDRADLGAWAPVLAQVSDIELPEGQAHYIHDGVYRVLNEGIANELGKIEPMAVTPRFRTPSEDRRSADRSGVVWRPSPNTSERTTDPSMVIVHTCEGSYSGCWSWLTNSRSGVSAHYVVNGDGTEVSQLVSEDRKAWHIGAEYDCTLNASVKCEHNGTSTNNFTLGIEHAGYGSQSSWSTGLLDRSASLLCDLSTTWDIPLDRYHVVGHGQLQPYNRSDPGRNWPWDAYLDRAAAVCGAEGGTDPEEDAPGSDERSTERLDLIIDSNPAANDSNTEVELSDSWTGSNNVSGYWNTGYWWRSTGSSADAASFWFYLEQDQRMAVQAWWAAAYDRSREAPFLLFDADGTELGRVDVDQSTGGAQWNDLGTYPFTAGWNRVALSRWTTPGYVVVADAVRVTSAP